MQPATSISECLLVNGLASQAYELPVNFRTL